MIHIVTKSYCPYCHAALQLLDVLGYEYEHIDVTENEDRFISIQDESLSRTVPQIFAGEISNENFIGGYSEISALHESGKLKEILDNK